MSAPRSWVEYIPPQRCPRCGKEFYKLWHARRGKHVYVYALHGSDMCYLGPADRYRYVSRLHNARYEGIHNIRWLYNHVLDLVNQLRSGAMRKLGLAYYDSEKQEWIVDSEAANRLADALVELAEQLRREAKEYEKRARESALRRLEREDSLKHSEEREEWHLVEVQKQLEEALREDSSSNEKGGVNE